MQLSKLLMSSNANMSSRRSSGSSSTPNDIGSEKLEYNYGYEYAVNEVGI